MFVFVFVFVFVFAFVYSVRLLAVYTCVSPNICIKALLTARRTCVQPANLDKHGHQAGRVGVGGGGGLLIVMMRTAKHDHF